MTKATDSGWKGKVISIEKIQAKEREKIREEVKSMDWFEFRAKHQGTDQRTFLLTISDILKLLKEKE